MRTHITKLIGVSKTGATPRIVRILWRKALVLVVSLLMALSVFTVTACSAEDVEDVLDIAIDVLDALETEEGGGNASNEGSQEDPTVQKDGWYHTKEDVALYIHLYGELPGNFITKQEAQDLGWDSSEGNLWDVAQGMSIGGDKFGNREGKLPKATGRQYYECDINYAGGYRDAERLVYSNDGLVYYTNDHYETFTKLYGEE